MSEEAKLTKADFVSGAEVRWCPGCGDFAILAAVQKTMPKLGIPREKIVFISGIGCSSRFPYYMNTYGFHTIHGRAMTVATGLKCANPDLSVWVVTGDGDALSIGGNHFIHALRRNVDLKILLFDNRIYGLTKGQYSPTSVVGQKTKTTPFGSIDYPIRPASVAIASECTFVARAIDSNVEHLTQVLEAAAKHKGTSFVNIYQNCVIFNDGAWKYLTDKEVRDDNILMLKHGEPMIFGKERTKGIVIRDEKPTVVKIGENGIKENDILVHDETLANPTIAFMLSQMSRPYPVPIGILRRVERPTYDEMMHAQHAAYREKKGKGDLQKLFREADTWKIG